MYKTFVYSPEVTCIIEGVDVSADVVSGSVRRVVDGASTLSLVLSNKGFRYTAHHQFRRMDRVVVWMKRVNEPIKVFTGYLNVVPGIQLYPSTVRLEASCTIKRLLYTYWDPGLEASKELLNQRRIPWGKHPEGGKSDGSDTDADDDKDDDDPDNATPDDEKDRIGTDVGGGLTGIVDDINVPSDPDAAALDGATDMGPGYNPGDTGLGMILTNVLVKAGGWDPDTVLIQNFPEPFFKTVMANMPEDIHGLNTAGMEKVRDMFDFYEKIAGSSGSTAPGQLGPLTANQIDHAKEVRRAAQDMNMNPEDDAVILAYMTVFVESEWRILANPVVPESMSSPNEGIGTDHTSTGLFQQQTHWGTNEQRMNAYGSATLFYDALRKQPNWSTRPRGEVCQAVQVSAKPLEYAKREGEAIALLAIVKGEDPDGKGASGGGDPKSNKVNPSTGMPANKPNRPTKDDSKGKDPNAPDTSGMNVWRSIEAVGLYKFPMMQMTSGQDGRYDGTHHQAGHACDFSNAGNEGSQEMKDMAQWWYENFLGKGTLEIIHHPSPYNVHNDTDVGTGYKPGYGGYDAGTMNDHRNHVHIAMAGVVSADGTTSTAGLGGGAAGGGSNIQWENKLAKNLFTYMFEPERFNDDLSEQLTGKHASLNDQPMIQIVKALCDARLCHFQSGPDGTFNAFYPDYFGLDGTAPEVILEDIEVKDFTISVNDNSLATHVYSQGSQGPDPGSVLQGMDGYLHSPGIVTVEDEWLFKLATQEMYFQPEFDDVDEFLGRYGVRPFRKDHPMVNSEDNPAAMLVVAIKLFMEKWAQQYDSQISLTFMPELFPGFRIILPSHNLAVYVQSVTHSFDYNSSFTTTCSVIAPTQPRTQAERDAMWNEVVSSSEKRRADADKDKE